MPVDATVLSALDTAAAHGIQAAGAFFEQHAAMIATHAEQDGRLMSGYLAAQLFNEHVMQDKTAYHTPVDPAAAPQPAGPITK